MPGYYLDKRIRWEAGHPINAFFAKYFCDEIISVHNFLSLYSMLQFRDYKPALSPN